MFKLLFIFLFPIIAVGCHSKQENRKESNIVKMDHIDKDSITIPKAKKLDLLHAEAAFGRPVVVDEFIVDEALTEFRISIYNFIKPGEYKNKHINIKERTWLKDANTYITVWYRLKDKNWVALDALEWPKGAEF